MQKDSIDQEINAALERDLELADYHKNTGEVPLGQAYYGGWTLKDVCGLPCILFIWHALTLFLVFFQIYLTKKGEYSTTLLICPMRYRCQ